MDHCNCVENILKGSKDGEMLTQAIENDALIKGNGIEVAQTFQLLDIFWRLSVWHFLWIKCGIREWRVKDVFKIFSRDIRRMEFVSSAWIEQLWWGRTRLVFHKNKYLGLEFRSMIWTRAINLRLVGLRWYLKSFDCGLSPSERG